MVIRCWDVRVNHETLNMLSASNQHVLLFGRGDSLARLAYGGLMNQAKQQEHTRSTLYILSYMSLCAVGSE